MKGKKLLSFVLVLVMVLIPLSVSVSAADAADCLTLDQLGTTYKLQDGFNVSDFGTATIDGTKDDSYTEYSHVRANYLEKVTDAGLDVYYANDNDYLYVYATVTLPTGYDIDGTDLIRFYIDFYNKHERVFYDTTSSNTYQNEYLNGNGYNGGQFQFNANDGSFAGGRGAAGKVTEHIVTKTYADSAQTTTSGYIIEAKITLPNYVKTAISSGKAPVIGVGYELRKTNTWNASYFQPGILENRPDTSRSPFNWIWGDYSLCPDLVLSTASGSTNAANEVKPLVEAAVVADAAKKTVTVDGTLNAEEGWSVVPFALLDRTVAETSARVTSNVSNVKVSADEEYIYVGLESYDLTSTAAKLHVAFGKDGDGYYGAGDKNDFVTVELDLQSTAEPVKSLTYGDGQAYTPTDPLGATTAAIVRSSDKVTAEIKIPIPTGLLDSRISTKLELAFGAVEIFPETEGATGYTVSEENGATAAVIPMFLPLSANPEIENLPQWIEDSKDTSNYTSLAGITVNVMGDQYLTGGSLSSDYVWTGLLSTKYSWDLKLYAENGAFVAESSLDTSETTPLYKAWRKLDRNDPDIIVVSGGHQDMRAGIAIGDINSTDEKTFMGALNTLFDKMREKYPDAMFVYTTTWNVPTTAESSYAYQSYVQAAEQVCAAQGVYCFKAYDPNVSGVDMSDATFVSQYVMSDADYDCLKLSGMKLVMPKYEKFLADSLADWTVNKDSILAARPTLDYSKDDEGDASGTDGADTTPTTQAPEQTTAAPVDEKKGCGSYIGASAVVLVAITTGAGVVFGRKSKKKEN